MFVVTGTHLPWYKFLQRQEFPDLMTASNPQFAFNLSWGLCGQTMGEEEVSIDSSQTKQKKSTHTQKKQTWLEWSRHHQPKRQLRQPEGHMERHEPPGGLCKIYHR